MLEEIEFMIDEPTVEFAHAIGVSEEVGPSICQIVAGRIRDIMRDLDLFHLAAIDGMRTEIAGNR
jgi:hypothetical protein